jgi:hypothetical protein
MRVSILSILGLVRCKRLLRHKLVGRRRRPRRKRRVRVLKNHDDRTDTQAQGRRLTTSRVRTNAGMQDDHIGPANPGGVGNIPTTKPAELEIDGWTRLDRRRILYAYSGQSSAKREWQDAEASLK